MSKMKPLPERITDKYRELQLAREDGAADWIEKAEKELNDLFEVMPRGRIGTWEEPELKENTHGR